MKPELVSFVERLLDDWESDQHVIDGEFGCSQADYERTVADIAERRAEWERLRAQP